MLKKILTGLLTVLFLGTAGFAGWWFFLRPTPLLGTLENSRTITLNLYDNVFFDVQVPNEAVLRTTDEHYTYEFDLLTVGVQTTEPELADYKIQVDGRWLYATSDKYWLYSTVHSFEHNKSYTVEHAFPEIEGIDWATGPAPVALTEPTVTGEDSVLYGEDGYLIFTKEFNMWEGACNNSLDKLAQATGKLSPAYYSDGKIFYAEQGEYCVGIRAINFNTQYAVFAKGPEGCAEARAILVKGVD